MSKYSYRRELSGADVDALFAGNFTASEKLRCDRCQRDISDDDALTFGDQAALMTSVHEVFGGTVDLTNTYTWYFEMPVEPGGTLEREIRTLRVKLQREVITMCYACVDMAQTPLGRKGTPDRTISVRQPTPVDELAPRLFAVE